MVIILMQYNIINKIINELGTMHLSKTLTINVQIINIVNFQNKLMC